MRHSVLVAFFFIYINLFCVVVALCDLVHDVEIISHLH